MSGDPQRSPILVDLTGLEDEPPNPLSPMAGPPNRKRHVRTHRAGNLSMPEEDDLEIVDVRESELDENDRKRRRMLRKMERRRNLLSAADNLSRPMQARPKRASLHHNPLVDQIDVIEERQLTPQERLKAIQERHARGETVLLDQHQNQNSVDTPGSLPMNFHGQRHLRRESNSIISQIFRHFRRYPRLGLWGDQDAFANYDPQHYPNHEVFSPHNTEEQNLQRVMDSSMMDTWMSSVNVSKLKKPAPSEKVPSGFTYSPSDPENLVCIKCQHPLGKTKHYDKDSLPPYAEAHEHAKIFEAQSSKIYVRGCSHVYCGACTHEMKYKSPKERRCPVQSCTKISVKKRGQFREVFL